MARRENGGETRGWLKLGFACPVEMAEAAGDLLAVLSGCGVEQSPETDGFCVLNGFFALDAADEDAAARSGRVEAETAAALAGLFALYGRAAPELRREMLADEDWAVSWRQYFKPFAVVEGLVIRPGWEEYAPGPGELVLEMDPGRAFGTGRHASTRLALGLMREAMRRDPPERVLDVGTGTGVLAMAAALWGADRILALDNDPEAVRAATENAARNGLADRIGVSLAPLAETERPCGRQGGGCDLIVANIVHDALVEMLPDLARLAAPGGRVVLAGILAGGQEENIRRLYGEAGFALEAAAHEDEWAALRFRRGT